MVISIASILIEIENSLLCEKTALHLKPFSVADTYEQKHPRFQVILSKSDSFLHDFSPTIRLNSIQYQESGSSIIINDHFSCFRIDTEKRYMEIFPTFKEYLTDLDLITDLKLLFSLLVIEIGGVLLHSSVVFKNKSAFVFTGQSGSGKSTIFQLLRPSWSTLNEEFNVLLPVQEQKQILAYSSPFGAIKGQHDCVPAVKSIFLIRKSVSNKIRDISGQSQFLSLLKNTCCFPSTNSFGTKLL